MAASDRSRERKLVLQRHGAPAISHRSENAGKAYPMGRLLTAE